MQHVDIKPHYDAVVIGAGPAGMIAAITLQQHGLSVVVFDEQAMPGGQIYRNVQRANTLLGSVLTDDSLSQSSTKHGADLVARFLACGAVYCPETLVWSVEESLSIALMRGDTVRQTSCRFLVVATGAQERPVPFKGWELPGVMGVGAAQIMLKSAGVVPEKPPVLFGTGPLFYLYASQLISAGVVPAAILDTGTRKRLINSTTHIAKALTVPRYLKNGIALLQKIRRADVVRYSGVSDVVASGAGNLEQIEFASAGVKYSLNANLLLSHHGVIPETRLLQSVGAECQWDKSGQCWRPVINQWGETTVAGIYSIGDGAAISGAYSAEHDAAVACFEILHRAGILSSGDRDTKARSASHASMRDKRIRPFLETMYGLPELLNYPSADTLVCRCESVTAKQVADAVDQGCHGPNQVKSFTRCGMGACQGRMCGPAVEAIIAKKTNRSRAEVGRFRARAPVRPVSLAAIASLHSNKQDV